MLHLGLHRGHTDRGSTLHVGLKILLHVIHSHAMIIHIHLGVYVFELATYLYSGVFALS